MTVVYYYEQRSSPSRNRPSLRALRVLPAQNRRRPAPHDQGDVPRRRIASLELVDHVHLADQRVHLRDGLVRGVHRLLQPPVLVRARLQVGREQVRREELGVRQNLVQVIACVPQTRKPRVEFGEQTTALSALVSVLGAFNLRRLVEQPAQRTALLLDAHLHLLRHLQHLLQHEVVRLEASHERHEIGHHGFFARLGGGVVAVHQPALREVGAYHGDGQRHDEHGGDHGDGGHHLALDGGRVRVAVPHGHQRHHAPPERPRDGGERVARQREHGVLAHPHVPLAKVDERGEQNQRQEQQKHQHDEHVQRVPHGRSHHLELLHPRAKLENPKHAEEA
mmetsp:Transcript_1044/g.4051  ORF Transcript_1044/g.4051 Transcript_1044/m.4051 type:complete len:336 (+) Transcript_1044:2282-3289(+)